MTQTAARESLSSGEKDGIFTVAIQTDRVLPESVVSTVEGLLAFLEEAAGLSAALTADLHIESRQAACQSDSSQYRPHGRGVGSQKLERKRNEFVLARGYPPQIKVLEYRSVATEDHPVNLQSTALLEVDGWSIRSQQPQPESQQRLST